MEHSEFTSSLRRVLGNTKKEAERLGINYVGTEEMLYGILCTPDCLACKTLAKYGVTKNSYYVHFEKTLLKNYNIGDYTPRAKSAITDAGRLAARTGAGYVTAEHLLLAILRKRDCRATDIILKKTDADYDAIVKELEYLIEHPFTESEKPAEEEKVAEETAEEETTPLDKFGYDLTKKAKEGKLDPVIGRSDEIERVIKSLSRRTKNSPVLIGEPGVGKSAVVEGLAIEIAKGSVPETLRDKKIFSLSLSGMLAGTKYRGEFEQRFREAIDYVIDRGNIILFIDEIHNVMGAGNTGDSNMDLADMLKPMLARGELQTIGATTIDEYRRYIEPDSAMERRFQPILVNPPDEESAVAILKGLKDKYEAHHEVSITDEAIRAAVRLSERYITDRFLPDKAIDLIDEAAAKARLDYCYTPPVYAEYQRKYEELASEKKYLYRTGQTDQLRKIQAEMDDIVDKMEEIDEKQIEARINDNPSIGEEEIAEVVSEWTGIPLSRLSEEESEKLVGLEDELRERVIGQDGAIREVSRAIKRARAKIKDPSRPIGVFMFVGPTGVGKTELSKALADVVFGDKDALIRLDMSEYSDKIAVTKLIGAPPGYVGYEEAGVLTEKVRRKPYSVVLFDEIEKADPEIYNLTLQIFDEGRLTDSKGKLVNFRNTIIILTSNVGASEISAPENAFLDEDEIKEEAYKSLRRKFSPEFLNRLDDVVVFRPLSKEDCGKIVDVMLEGLKKRLKEQDIELEVAASATDLIVRRGYDERNGARALKRAIRRIIEDYLSEEIILGKIKRGDKVTVYADGGEVYYGLG